MFKKIKNLLALNDDEDFDGFEEDFQDKYEQEQKVEQQPQEQQMPQQKPEHTGGKAKVLSLVPSHNSLSRGDSLPKVILLEPRSYQEVQDIADHLKSRRAVVINLQRMPKDQAKRVVDFLSGTVYAIGGDIQKLGVQTFICTPDNIDVSGTITDYIQEHEYMDKRW